MYRKMKVTIVNVEAIPCSLIGMEMVFSMSGEILHSSWNPPWSMPWVEDELRKLVLLEESISQTRQVKITNPDERDQEVVVDFKNYVDLTLPQLLSEICDRYAKREALINGTGSRRYTYEQLQQLSDKLAAGLLQMGLQKGEHVSIWAVNSPEFVITQFGIVKCGCVMVPLNAYEKELRMEEILSQSDTTTLILQVGTKGTENIELLYKMCPELFEDECGQLNSRRFPNLKRVIVISDEEYIGTYRWFDVLEKGDMCSKEALKARIDSIQCSDVAHMIYTSGTTGKAKGVMLSHNNVIENALALSKRMELTEEDVVCVQAPMFHCFGCNASVVTAVSRGASMVMVSKFDAATTLSLIERERCSIVSGVPTMFISFIEEQQKNHYDISSIRTGILAGAPCPEQVVQQIEEQLGISKLIVSYGLTETSPCVTASYPDDSLERKQHTVGKVMAGIQIKIVDVETGKEPLSETAGEICVKGCNVMQGYYRMPDEMCRAFDSDGWFHTGDMGYVREDGYLVLGDRKKDIIIRSGENISPSEIENHINTHEKVEQAVIVGVPDPLYGEEVAVFIKVKDKLTVEELTNYCRGKIANNKIPVYVEFMDEFPTSESGKVLKRELKQMAIAKKNQMKEKIKWQK